MIALLCGSGIIAGTASTDLGILECSEDNWKLGRYYKGTYFLMVYQYTEGKEPRAEGSCSTGTRIAVKINK